MVNKIMVNKTVKIEFPRFLLYSRGAINVLVRLALVEGGGAILRSDAVANSLHTRRDRVQMITEVIVTKAALTL